MPAHKVVVECRVPEGFGVDQVRGMFDLPEASSARAEFAVELPGLDEQWQLGVIVGPSGSGKTSVARHAYGDAFVSGFAWDPVRAVVDHFDGCSIKQVTHTLTAVGFSSPPSWI